MATERFAEPAGVYRCPGQAYPISRWLHLGRLARFYPACRDCPHRHDTGTLTARQVRQMAETGHRARRPPLLHDEGVAGVVPNDLRPSTVGRIAAAFGVCAVGGCASAASLTPSAAADQDAAAAGDDAAAASEASAPTVVLAGDGRPMTAEPVAAAAEGLRWAGCNVVDIGPATSACLALAIEQLRAGGGLMVGNPGRRPHQVGLSFWDGRPQPLSAGAGLEQLEAAWRRGLDRPVRRYGRLGRFAAGPLYLERIAPRYHALRPLRFVLDSASRPLVACLETLTRDVACRALPFHTAGDRLAGAVKAAGVHFAARVDGDGERCELFDEQGRPVPPERILLMFSRELAAERPGAVVVVEPATPPAVVGQIEAAGAAPLAGGLRRAEMAEAMRRHRAALGGGPSGRFWFGPDGAAAPDALMAITLLLTILSRSDRPFSKVLEDEAAAGSALAPGVALPRVQ